MGAPHLGDVRDLLDGLDVDGEESPDLARLSVDRDREAFHEFLESLVAEHEQSQSDLPDGEVLPAPVDVIVGPSERGIEEILLFHRADRLAVWLSPLSARELARSLDWAAGRVYDRAEGIDR